MTAEEQRAEVGRLAGDMHVLLDDAIALPDEHLASLADVLAEAVDAMIAIFDVASMAQELGAIEPPEVTP